jgi:hypothetical protein
MAWARTYDIDTPDGSVDDPAEAADRMNEIKLATQERENVDHFWPLTGSEVSDHDAAEHRKITLRTLSAVEVAALTATKAYIYRLVTDGELYFKDDDDNTIKLTSGGKILSASLDMKDEDAMGSDSATHAATQQSIKAYADAVAAAVAAAATAEIAAADRSLSAYTNLDSDDNAMLPSHAYKAATDGMVIALANVDPGSARDLRLYIGITNDPAGAGDLIDRNENDGSAQANYRSVSFLVAKGEYFEITTYAATPTIRWRSFGTLSKPIDQN